MCDRIPTEQPVPGAGAYIPPTQVPELSAPGGNQEVRSLPALPPQGQVTPPLLSQCQHLGCWEGLGDNRVRAGWGCKAGTGQGLETEWQPVASKWCPPCFMKKEAPLLAVEKREHMGIKNASDLEVSWLFSEKFENMYRGRIILPLWKGGGRFLSKRD